MNPCFLIPNYNHGETIAAVAASLAEYDLPLIVVDDGSDAPTAREIDRLAEEFEWISLVRRPQNGGRGAALRDGYFAAAERGFTHALQLDADGQHDAKDVPRLLAAARENPEALVLGRPIFDDSAPAMRMFGRKFSQVLVWLETLSFRIEDPLCGFRVFPLESTLRLLERSPLGNRMDLDPEIVVRLFWEGVPIVSVPTRVQYYEHGVSHFAPAYDSWLIAKAHARLVAGMIPRAPRLLARGWRGSE